eukprot:Polyplicarium_translucidae@DN2580_c0_g1_i2.p2
MGKEVCVGQGFQRGQRLVKEIDKEATAWKSRSRHDTPFTAAQELRPPPHVDRQEEIWLHTPTVPTTNAVPTMHAHVTTTNAVPTMHAHVPTTNAVPTMHAHVPTTNAVPTMHAH